MFYEGEENNSGSKEMTVNYIDELITTKIQKASGFFEYHSTTIIVTLHEALSSISLCNCSKRKITER